MNMNQSVTLQLNRDTGAALRAVFVSVIGIVCSLICVSQNTSGGMEFLFLLPLAFSFSYLLFGRAYAYWKDNIGLTVLFISVLVRYLGTPVLMSLAGTTVQTLNPTEGSLKLAVFVQIFELFATLAIVDRVWTKYKKKDSYGVFHGAQSVDFKLSLFGILFLAALVVLVVLRGHLGNVFSHLSTWWSRNIDATDLYTYDLVAFEVIKSAAVITLVSLFACGYRKYTGFIKGAMFFLAVLAAVANTMLYQYDARTALAQLIFSSIFMLLSFFPEMKKAFYPVFAVAGIGLVAFIFLEGSMGYDVSAGFTGGNTLEKAAKMAELYVSGPSVMAKTYDTIDYVRANMSMKTVISDMINCLHFFGMLPFLRFIPNSVAGITITNELFVSSIGGLTYIMPNNAFSNYYFGMHFGWLFEIVLIYVVIKTMTKVDEVKSKSRDGCFYYALTYFELLLGQAVFVNNFYLLWHAFTNLPFWLLVFAYVNRLGRKIKMR